MSTTENKRSAIVALFVALALLILVSGIFVLGGQQKRFEKTLELKAVFSDISGLRKGNNVWFSGVKIGTVKKIFIHGESQVEIVMRIEEDVQRYIRKDAKAKISSESLIGNKIILIYGGSNDSPTVADGDALEAESPLDTEDMMATLQENNKNLVSVTNDLKTLTANLVKGKGTVGTLLTDTTLAINFKGIVANLERVSANTMRASGALTSFTSKLNTKGGLANQLMTDTTVFSQLKTSVAQLQETTSSAAKITENLTDASTKLNQNNNGIGVLLNDEQFASQMKNTMENLETSTQKLDENMEALQHNFLLRGFFKRKAKNQTSHKAESEYK